MSRAPLHRLCAQALAMPILLLACVGAPPSEAGTVVHVVADELSFDQARLTVKADVAFELVLDNRERGIPHNVSIYTDESASQPVVVGSVTIGPALSQASVPPLVPGQYFFRCDVHRIEMTGHLHATAD